MSNKMPTPTGTSMTVTERQKNLSQLLISKTAELKKVIPAGYSVPAFINGMMQETQLNPEILNAEPASLYFAMMKALHLGILPGKVNGGKAHFVLYGKKVELIIGYGHLIDKAYANLGVLLFPETVYENDHFIYHPTELRVEHIPSEGDRGAPKGCYVVADMPKRERFARYFGPEVMTAAQAAAGNGNSQHSPWNKPDTRPEMFKKTAVKRFCKYLPDPELQRLSADDNISPNGVDMNLDGLDVAEDGRVITRVPVEEAA